MHEAIIPLREPRVLREPRALHDPLLIAAFAGPADPTGSAPATVAYLVEQWAAETFAELDAQRFYDFTVQRPHMHVEGGIRTIDWPTTRFYAARPPGAQRDVVLLVGPEPGLRWRTFIEAVTDVAGAAGATTCLTLGAQAAAIPHTRSLPVVLADAHPALELLLGLSSSARQYEGAASIASVLRLHWRSLGWSTASLRAMAPHYLNLGPNPAVADALVRALDRALGASTPHEALDEHAAGFGEQAREAMARTPGAEAYVRQLEDLYDAARPPRDASAEGRDERDERDEREGDRAA